MKKIFYLLILLFGFFMSGCDSDEEDSLLGFSILKSDVCFTAAGGDGTIEIAVPGAYKVTSSTDWCRVTPVGSQIKVTVPPNPELATRTALVKITYAGATLSLPVTQTGSILILESSELAFKAAPGRYAYFIDNNVGEWHAEVAAGGEWCSAVTKEDSLILEVSLNSKATERTTLLSIRSGNVAKTLSVLQKGVRINPSVEELTYTPRGGTKKIVFTDIIPTWSVTVADGWCTFKQLGDTLIVNVPLYAETADRNTILTIQAGEVTRDIPVIQTGVQPLNQMFVNSNDTWKFDKTKTGGDYTTIFNLIDAGMSQLGEMMVKMYVKKNDREDPSEAAAGSHELEFITYDGVGFWLGGYVYDFTIVNGTEDQVTFALSETSYVNGAYYYNKVEGLQYLLTYLETTFKVTADDPIAPTELTFTDLEYDFYFTLVLEEAE